MTRWKVFVFTLLSLVSIGTPAHALEDEPMEPKHTPVMYTISLDLDELNKFELGPGTVNAEFVVTVRCDREPCHPQLEIGNGKLLGKTEKIADLPLEKKYRMKAELDGFVDLSGYPFDAHEIQLALYEKHDSFQTRLRAGDLYMNSRLRLPGWKIGEKARASIEQMDAGDRQKQDQYVFAMDVRRPRLAQTMKALVPVFFMLLVAAVGLFLRPKSIGARFAASTGGLVPLVMFHIGQINSLPAVSYLTRLDKIMLASYLAFFVHIVFNLLILRSEEVKTEDHSASLYKIASVTVPVLTVAFWGLALFL